jgi:hypothetical protein
MMSYPARVLMGIRKGTGRMIGQAEAVAWARAYCFGHCQLAPYTPTEPIDEHPPDQFYFFAVVGAAYFVGGDHVIAVRKTDGKISCCGVVGLSRRDSRPLGVS